MKVAFKIALPLVIVITILIWFVTDTFNNTQLEVVRESQTKSAKEITKQFQKNKMQTILNLQKDVEVTASLIADISAQNVWNYTHENLEKPLGKYLELEYLKAIEIYDSSDNQKAKVTVGKINPNLKILEKEILHEDRSIIGFAKVYYDDQYITEYFQKSKQNLLEQISQNNLKQDQFIDEILTQRTYVNFSITFVVLIILLATIYIVILRPLQKLENGLDSFFDFLQNKAKKIAPINLKTNDEFGRMGSYLNDNISVTSKLHQEIYELNSNLEAKVSKRTVEVKEKSDQIAQLLNNTEEGFLSFGKELIVDSEYSKECENIFQKSISNENIGLLLYDQDSEDYNLFTKVIADVFDPKIKQKRKTVLLHLLPKELLILNNYIKIEYKPISAEKIMLILINITEKKKLEKKVEKEKQTLKMVVSVISDIQEFKDLVEEYKTFYNKKKQFIQDEKRFLNAMIEYYRTIHTFKGNFAQKDLLNIVPRLHQYESELNQLLKKPDKSFQEFKELLEHNNIVQWLDEDIELIENILDQNILQEENIINVSETLIAELEYDVKQILSFPKNQREVTYEKLFEDVINIRKKPIITFFKSYPKLVDQLSKRLNKKIYPLKILGGEDIYVTNRIQPFLKTLVHVFRNSLDHGIESLEERISSGKDESATVTCNIEQHNDTLDINIIDDGKGIDLRIIEQKALEKGIITTDELALMDVNEKLMIIFSDTFSTKDEVTQLSGRGVGLGAVKGELEKLEGKIEINSKSTKGTAFKFTIPLKMII